MATRKALSAKKVPVKKATSKKATLRKTSAVKGKAGKGPVQKKQKDAKASAVKGKARIAPSKKKTKAVKANAVKAKPRTKAPGKKETAASKAVAKTGIAKPENWMAAAEKKIAAIRSEFKKSLKTEVAAAFDVCLAAMENAANLMESRLVTVLGEMSNLVSGAKPDFRNGKLKSVVSEDGKETTDFSYGNDGLVTSRTYRDGKLKFEIVHGKLGNPLSGKMFDSSGNVVKEFSYGPDGQVK